jgi:hypothetical protein
MGTMLVVLVAIVTVASLMRAGDDDGSGVV